MSIWSIIVFALLFVGAAAATWSHAFAENDQPPAPPTPAQRLMGGVLNFFGIGGVPLSLTLAVLLSSAAVAGVTLDSIAVLHWGPAYPDWFVLDALATGLGFGLLSARLLAASYPRDM